ncbi:MAG: zinc-ribbon domain-containing protein [Bacillota bacterium]
MFSDKTLRCGECGENFTFTAGEQEFFATEGFENKPTWCRTCRAIRKNNSRGYSLYLSIKRLHTLMT